MICKIVTLTCQIEFLVSHFNTGVFRKAAQSLVCRWALILGGRLYGANIWV